MIIILHKTITTVQPWLYHQTYTTKLGSRVTTTVVYTVYVLQSGHTSTGLTEACNKVQIDPGCRHSVQGVAPRCRYTLAQVYMAIECKLSLIACRHSGHRM